MKYHVCSADILNVYNICIYSLELLSLTSGLVPALLLYGNHSQLAEAVLSVLQQKLSSLSLSELVTAPAQVICMQVISYVYVHCLTVLRERWSGFGEHHMCASDIKDSDHQIYISQIQNQNCLPNSVLTKIPAVHVQVAVFSHNFYGVHVYEWTRETSVRFLINLVN